MALIGSCRCGIITYELKQEPKKIALCHCMLRLKYHRKIPVPFAPYAERDINFSTDIYFRTIRSSKVAKRYACDKCGTILYMQYDQSKIIWLVTSTCHFATNQIEWYDINLF